MSAERQEKNEQEIARSREAQQIMNTPIFVESMAKLKQGIIDLWAACPARDTPGREWLWQHYQVALRFEEELNTILNTGKLALKEREMSLAERVGQKIRSIV
ncbi:MAG: hypothetical protein ACREUY_02850 [Burkholderiales bacterium]